MPSVYTEQVRQGVISHCRFVEKIPFLFLFFLYFYQRITESIQSVSILSRAASLKLKLFDFPFHSTTFVEWCEIAKFIERYSFVAWWLEVFLLFCIAVRTELWPGDENILLLLLFQNPCWPEVSLPIPGVWIPLRGSVLRAMYMCTAVHNSPHWQLSNLLLSEPALSH